MISSSMNFGGAFPNFYYPIFPKETIILYYNMPRNCEYASTV